MANVDNLLNTIPPSPLDEGAVSRPSRVRYVVLAVLCSIGLIAYLHRVGFASGGPPIKRDLALSDVHMGNLLTIL